LTPRCQNFPFSCILQQFKGPPLPVSYGKYGFKEVVVALADAQEKLSRETNPSVYTEAEFRKKIQSGQHFIDSVLTGPKILVIGDEHELARLAE
jgi:hypothetical protein